MHYGANRCCGRAPGPGLQGHERRASRFLAASAITLSYAGRPCRVLRLSGAEVTGGKTVVPRWPRCHRGIPWTT